MVSSYGSPGPRHFLAVRIEDFPSNFGRASVGLSIVDHGLQVNDARAVRNILRKLAVNKRSIRRKEDRPGLDQPDVTINAGPFVKPALELRGIDPHGQGILAAAVRQVGDVVAENCCSRSRDGR